MSEVLNFKTIKEYNDWVGVKTYHPLVSVIDFSEVRVMKHFRMLPGFYTVFLKEIKCGDLIYGRQTYDYQEGTVVAIAPDQVYGRDDNGEEVQPKGYALLFHPDLVSGTPLGKRMHEYNFFSYEVNEALHLSEQERKIFLDCLMNIQNELKGATDRLSKRLIATNVELLLDYCLRFYERQFVTRETVNKGILSQFENVLNEYFINHESVQNGLPSVKYCAQKVCLSPNYFGDLVKKETGKTAQEFIQSKIINISKDLVLDPSKSISQVAYELGFQYPQHFSRMFKKMVGVTPVEWREQQVG